MKLRLARKIVSRIGTPRGDAYCEAMKERALARCARTKSQREDVQFWDALMLTIGIHGRVQLLAKSSPGLAFGLMMRSPLEEWIGVKPTP